MEHMQNKKNISCCIVIPAYKDFFDKDEAAAVNAYFKVFTEDKYFIVPESLDMKRYTDAYPDALIKRFPDSFFKGTKGYNKLMLSDFFYRAFKKYEYMLIAQPDAALLSKEDKLPEFIEKGYDLTGAPWEPERNIWEAVITKKDGIRLLKKRGKGISMGNGGFCLRKTEACRKLLKKEAWRKLYWYRSEDIFFAVAGLEDKDFKLSDVENGRAFSLEYGIKTSIDAGHAPYAVHGWSKEFKDYAEMAAYVNSHGGDMYE